MVGWGWGEGLAFFDVPFDSVEVGWLVGLGWFDAGWRGKRTRNQVVRRLRRRMGCLQLFPKTNKPH